MEGKGPTLSQKCSTYGHAVHQWKTCEQFKIKLLQPKLQVFYNHTKLLNQTESIENLVLIQKLPHEMVYKKGVLKNFSKITEKRLCQSLFFNKVAVLRPATLSKSRLRYRCSSEFWEIFKNTSGRLLLNICLLYPYFRSYAYILNTHASKKNPLRPTGFMK